MIATLQKEFLEYYGLTSTKYHVSSCRATGTIIKNDEKACRECKENGVQQCNGTDEEQTFIIQSENEIQIVDIESFLNQFNGREAGKGKKCDLMIYDENKILFAEMYCGNRKNLYSKNNKNDGKIAHARKQIADTFEKLYKVPALQTKLDSFCTKDGILAVREKVYNSLGDDEESQNMSVFIQSSESMSMGKHSMLEHDVTFKIVKYPDVYEW